MTIHEEQQNAIAEAREFALREGVVVHVYGRKEGGALLSFERRCSMDTPFVSAAANEPGTVIYHEESVAVNWRDNVCAACGQMPPGAEA
jgi:hypothetical protein